MVEVLLVWWYPPPTIYGMTWEFYETLLPLLNVELPNGNMLMRIEILEEY